MDSAKSNEILAFRMVIKIIWRAIGMGWNAQERDQILMAVWDNLSYNLFNLFNTTIMGGEESMYTHSYIP